MKSDAEAPSELLARWVALQHAGQKIKYTGEPYFAHLIAVANMAKGAIPLGFEIGLCHDLLEDTPVTSQELLETLVRLNYELSDAEYITNSVVELTDVFTASAYPDLDKKARKEREASRLASISADAQTIKYCDLIDNIPYVIKYEQKQAEKYLHRKKLLLSCMPSGNKDLHERALAAISNGLKTLS